ncbi:glutamate ABC transporter substrate-binding protein [Corynebacterium hansenii]|uniref:Glutamate ABC transporter substrate-binding protein n=1 Tax=Corynebacterium hansenii TaxID=394964 RepID=A0ABV7ZPS3_9CORY|nr:glutamate ABC transporter substrate-binding protein [Corynebacterium hansenii]WJZ01117.1 ABC transporter glutamine-binding protein GlnH precursor [Corynebacterium hansenii]
MRRSRPLAAALFAASFALAACAPQAPLVGDPFNEIIEGAQGGMPLPPESRYEKADSRPPNLPNGVVPDATPAPGTGPAEDRIPEIVDRGRIIIGVDQSLNLLGFRDSTTGELAGFEVALAQEIARDIFGSPDAVEFRYVDSTERIEALDSGRVDAVVRTMSVTPDREAAVDFSAPYLTARAGILVPASDAENQEGAISSAADLNGRRVCVAADSTPEEIVREEAPGAMLLLVRSWSDCLVALQQHQADAVVSDDTILAGINDQDPGTAIVRRGLSTENYAVGVKEGNVGLASQVNLTMERIRGDGTWQQLYDTWLGAFLPGGFQPSGTYAEVER